MHRRPAAGDRLHRGGEQPRGVSSVDCPQQRTRVVCSFDPSTGQIAAGESVLIWQERCWSVRPLEDFQVLEAGGGRSGLAAAS